MSFSLEKNSRITCNMGFLFYLYPLNKNNKSFLNLIIFCLIESKVYLKLLKFMDRVLVFFTINNLKASNSLMLFSKIILF